ncbi:MAG: hypothetical protein Q8M24_02725 [Pseudolabrys sp.]|nr:hypothetical protein [Pseudolabrys sp.]MDP2294360.1 hypothetical protein [Pseudolabrys sp.]
MSFKTSFDFGRADRPAAYDDIAGHDDAGLHASLGERVITTVAVALALLLVTTVAVLMGMA